MGKIASNRYHDLDQHEEDDPLANSEYNETLVKETFLGVK